MTNLEFYKDEIRERLLEIGYLGDAVWKVMRNHGKNHPRRDEEIIDWLCEEHKEPILLKQWEYDVASYYHSDTNFDTWSTLIGLKEKGHFKGITDTLMTLDEILSNCKIVSDDYEGFEECK